MAVEGLYDRIREMTRRETLADLAGKDSFEAVVSHYAAKLVDPDEGPVLPEEVPLALSPEKIFEFCGTHAHRIAMNTVTCSTLITDLQMLGRREEEIRALGRELELIATGYELPIDSFPGLPLSLHSKIESIKTLWTAGTVQTETDRPQIRVLPAPAGLEKEFEALAAILGSGGLIVHDTTGENREQFTAAVWRYRYGVRYVRSNRPPDYPPLPGPGDGPGTERQFLFHRWPDVEDALLKIRSRLHGMGSGPQLEPPLKDGEVIVFSMDRYKDIDPIFEEVRVWAYHEFSPKQSNEPDGDIGLQWVFPVDPVEPALLSIEPGHSDEPIVGGRYPPAPRDGTGLCSLPFGRLGYLCREITGLSDACSNPAAASSPSSAPSQSGQGKVVLARCQGLKTSQTQAGPNVCRTIVWQSIGYDQAPKTCKDCTVQLSCQPRCQNGDTVGYAGLKGEDGTIPVCIGTRSPIPPVYAALHELTHAQQACRLAPGTKPQTAVECCRMELEAHKTSCSAMATDGVFKDTDITIENCVASMSAISCRQNGFENAVCTSDTVDEQMFAKIVAAADQNAQSLPESVKRSCSDTIAPGKRDPRVQAILDGMLSVCNPLCQTSFRNTIGSNLCFSGQCVEESLEFHRLTPGRNTVGVQDQAFPWDACQAPDPMLAPVLTPPAEQQPVLPAYRPRLLIRALDIGLCQLNGLPSHTPSYLCETAPVPRSGQMLETIVEEALSAIEAPEEFRTSAQGLQDLSEGFASRIGSSLYFGTMQRTGRTLGDLISMAADLLDELPRVRFTNTMCPLNGASPSSLSCPKP